MYTEDTKKEINWGSFIKKGIIVLVIALVIFFIIWLFAKNNNSNINVNYGNGNNSNPSSTLNNTTYSKEYLEGYRYFHDTVKEYFLVNELPKNGETLKYTLQELINKGLIFAWEYKNGEPCDTEASYAYVTNENGKYKLTVTLVCGVEVSKTTEELGCNQLCPNGNCTNPNPDDEYITEYQYKQAYTDYEVTYSCPAGYTKNGAKCVKNNSTTVAATKKVTYSCPAGYISVGSGESMTCYKNTNDVKDATASTVYSCPSGYSRSGSKCYSTSSTYRSAKANVVYKCNTALGYKLEGTGVNVKCVKTETVNNSVKATKTNSYVCPDSTYTKTGSGANTKCTKTVDAKETTTYDCSKVGGTLVNEKYCRVSVKATYVTYEKYQGKTVTHNGVTCDYKGQYEDRCTTGNCTQLVHKYSCPATNKTVDATPVTEYKCSDSSYDINGTKCTKTVKATYATTYECPDSTYTKSGSGENTVCTKKETKTSEELAFTAKSYYCENKNEYLIGDKCYTDYEDVRSASKSVKYSCANIPNATYSLNGNKCTYTIREDKNAIKNTDYSCDKGYTKYGIGSDSVCTKGTTTSIDATKTTKKVTKYRYKWSSSETLEGWTRTGETRQSKVVKDSSDK